MQALRKAKVREVADNLFINFPAGEYLYPQTLPIAWIGTNHNLFQLLELNHRFPASSDLNQDHGIRVSDQAFAGLLRNIGFAKGFLPQDNATKDPMPFHVFDRKSTPSKSAKTNTGISLPYASNIQLPTLEGFEQFFSRDLILFGGFTAAEVLPIPIKNNRQANYSSALSAVWSSMKDDIFADSWKNNRGSTASMYIEYLGAKPGLKLSRSATKTVANISTNSFADSITNLNAASFFDSASAWDANKFAEKLGYSLKDFYKDGGNLYRWWQSLSKHYGDLVFSNGDDDNTPNAFFQTKPDPNNKTIPSFSKLFSELLDYFENNIPSADYKGFGSIQSVLQATLRFYMQFNYQGFAINTENSLPYSNGANPFVVGSFDQLNSQSWSKFNADHSWKDIYGDTWIDTFSGNEAWVDNLETDSLRSGEIIPELTRTNLYKSIFNEGWIPLTKRNNKKNISFVDIRRNINGDRVNGYKKIYVFDDQSTKGSQAVFFGRRTNSSDTLSATHLNSSSHGFINRNTKLRNGKRIRDLGGLVNNQSVLPDNFKTYISLSGGIDRVTGSDFADVIVGTTVGANARVTPGSLTAVAGAGDDVVAPGRGSGKISLGEGKDKLVIDRYDTLGRTTLFDFDFKNDTLVLHRRLQAFVDVNNDNILYVFSPGENLSEGKKILHLTQSSDSNWHTYFKNADLITQDALVAPPADFL